MALDVGVVMEQVDQTKTEYEGQIEALRAAMAAQRAQEADQRAVRLENSDGWLVVITKGQKELSVRDRLAAQGFEVYLPLQPVCERVWKRRGVVALPFFARMLFARATLDAYRWQAIFSTIGVQRVMCDPRSPKGVTNAFIERLRQEIVEEFLGLGLHDPLKPPPPKPAKDRKEWRKLGDVVGALMAEPVAEHRESLLYLLLSEAHPAITQPIRR